MSPVPYLKRLFGMPSLPTDAVGVDMLERDWSFQSSRAGPIALFRQWSTRGNHCAAPATRILKPVHPRPRWLAYFAFLPDGQLTPAHRFTLERLRAVPDAGLMVICATPTPADLPGDLAPLADALYWKALPGFDFSAYTLAISTIARDSAGSDLLLLNDSVFGPFGSLDRLWPRLRWDLSGFTASGQGRNHLQSYALLLRNVDERKACALSSLMSPDRAFDDFETVLLQQELRMATVAARSMSVGSLWYANPDRCANPSLFAALPLVEAGFPFLKRSLLTKHAGIYPRQSVLDTLRSFNHPLP